ncbi:hypothetical protein AMATHDRAFT_1995 [Amanita thiersii Skay4041]|uniref:DNA replication checkpoint mediator MRC1 domain-containing protein n=1 Tax=Amanita thiersii Skay4041 TaxID=703135 RepID=A0A2A9NNN2_9AGAR|nr:hypothetical protein AMATHDRAFT_1995 [Amanita thiersii Skay4041]
MSVTEDTSILEDPNLSLSSDLFDTGAIKRASVTYGRRRTIPTDSNPDYSNTYSVVSPLAAGKVGQDEETISTIAPSHSRLLSGSIDSDNDEGSNPKNASPGFIFGWRKRLKEMDNEDDFDLSPKNNALSSAPPQATKAAAYSLTSDARATIQEDTDIFPPTEGLSTSEYLNSDEQLLLSPPSEVKRDVFDSTPPDTGRRRVSKRVVVRDSDSESEHVSNLLRSSLNNSSPFVLRTPPSRSSPTPPTSDEDMPQRLATKSHSKGKQKATAVSRRSVPPLRFNEDVSTEVRTVSQDKRKQKSSLKAPTKKELLETAKSRVRLAADQQVLIPKSDNQRRFTIQTLFASIAGSHKKESQPPSDPIIPFSSSPSAPGYVLSNPTGCGVSSLQDGNPLATEAKTAEQEAKMKALHAVKQRALALQNVQKVDDDNDDDDIEIVESSRLQRLEAEVRATRGANKQKRHPVLGGVGSKSTSKNHSKDIGSILIGTKAFRADGHGNLTKDELIAILKERAEEQKSSLTKQKEEEWVRRGGRCKVPVAELMDHLASRTVLDVYVQRGLQNATKQQKAAHQMDEESTPIHSAVLAEVAESTYDSPTPLNNHIESSSDVDDQGDHDDDPENKPRYRKNSRRTVAILDSDSEHEDGHSHSIEQDLSSFQFGASALRDTPTLDESDDNSMPPPTYVPSNIHRGSISSLDEQAGDRSDKENNQQLMFDRSEDKENKAVVRHRILSPVHLSERQTTSNHGMERDATWRSSISPSPAPHGDSSGCEFGDLLTGNKRRPLAILTEDSLQPGPSRKALLSENLLPAPLTLDSTSRVLSPSDQKLDTFGSSFGVAPLLQPSFDDLFESGTDTSKSAQPVKTIGVQGSRDKSPDDLSLTQDVVLQPAFQAGDQLLRKAELIFEKEQEYLIKYAGKHPQNNQLYVNDFGFLTQTCPSNAEVEPYKLTTGRRSPGVSQSPSLKILQRQPLSTLSFSAPLESGSPDKTSRRRLIKRITPSPTSKVRSSSLSPSPVSQRKQTAFDLLAAGAKAQVKPQKFQKMFEKSDFVEAEAEESEDDDVFGFALGKKREDDEEEGEDLDATLEALVDDREMDKEILAAQLVHEKYMEHEKDDDEELEKLHQAAVQGELRRKRRNHGIGLDDSDDESDEDERNRRIRHRMAKRQRIDRDNIKALADNEETKSFYRVYQHDLDDDNAELAYLQQQDVVMSELMVSKDEEDTPEYVTREEIERRVRELACQDVVEPTLNPHDVSWIDDDVSDNDSSIRVRTVSSVRRRPDRRQGFDTTDQDHSMEVCNILPSTLQLLRDQLQVIRTISTSEGDRERSRMQSWARIEGKSRNMTTARSVGGATVTGHTKSKIKVGSGSTSQAPGPSARHPEQRKPLKSAPSMLAGVSDRSSRFG